MASYTPNKPRSVWQASCISIILKLCLRCYVLFHAQNLNCIVLIVLVLISFSHGYSAILAAKLMIKLDLKYLLCAHANSASDPQDMYCSLTSVGMEWRLNGADWSSVMSACYTVCPTARSPKPSNRWRHDVVSIIIIVKRCWSEVLLTSLWENATVQSLLLTGSNVNKN